MDNFIVLYHAPTRSEFMKEFLDLIWWFPRFIKDVGGIKNITSVLTEETNQSYYFLSVAVGDRETFCSKLTEKIKTINIQGKFVVFLIK